MVSKEDVDKLLNYNPKTGNLTWKVKRGRGVKPGDEAGHISERPGGLKYRIVAISGRKYRAHRMAFLIMKGFWPKNEIDHINGDGLDNRWVNLREASHQDNGKNCPLGMNNKSGHMGVHFYKQINRWVAYIKVDYKRIHIGSFEDYESAVEARKQAEVQYGFHSNHGRKREVNE